MPPLPVAPPPQVVRPPIKYPIVPREVLLGVLRKRRDITGLNDEEKEAALRKIARDEDRRQSFENLKRYTDSFLDYLRRKMDDRSWMGDVPWVGQGSGGKEVQPRTTKGGLEGQVDGALYRVYFTLNVTNYGDSYTQKFVLGEDFVGPVSFSIPGNGTSSCSAIVQAKNKTSGANWGEYVRDAVNGYMTATPGAERVDGESVDKNKGQDPNAVSAPPINQEPFGPYDTRGAKPPNTFGGGRSPKDPAGNDPRSDGHDIPGAVWDHPGIGPFTYPPGYGGSGKPKSPIADPTPQKPPAKVPTRSPRSPEPNPKKPGGTKPTQKKSDKPIKTTRWTDPETGITYETNTYPGGAVTVGAPINLNPPGTTLTPEGIRGARSNHDGGDQGPHTGITITQSPVSPASPTTTRPPSISTTPGRKPGKGDQRSPVPIINVGPLTINLPTPTQYPTPIERPKPPKQDPTFQPIPVKEKTISPDRPAKPSTEPTPPGDDSKPKPPIVDVNIIRPSLVNPIPILPISNNFRADPVTGNPVQPKPDPQPAKEEPKVGTPGSGGSTCLYPGYHPAVMGGHGTTQTSVGAVNTLISGTTNVAVNAVGKNVEKVVEAVGTPIAGKATTIFSAINNVQSFTEKFAKATRLDKVYNALTLFLVIHNASQLASNLGQSLDELINTGLQAIGIRDEKDEPLSISAAVGSSVSGFIKSIIGADVYNSASLAWKKGSAIYSASVNIADAITQPLAGLASGLTEVGNNTGKIGNALVKSGTVLEESYEKMSENILVSTGKLAQLNNYINRGDTAVELVDSFTELARVPLDTKESFDQVKTELDGLKTKMGEEVATKKAEDTLIKANSESVNISKSDYP